MTTHKKNTLCWSCANACGGCSWSDGSFTLVDGWTAERTSLICDRGEWADKIVESYLVKECPQFVCDKHKYKYANEEEIWY